MKSDDDIPVDELRRQIVSMRLARDAWIKQWSEEKEISDELYFFIKDALVNDHHTIDFEQFSKTEVSKKYKSSRGMA